MPLFIFSCYAKSAQISPAMSTTFRRACRQETIEAPRRLLRLLDGILLRRISFQEGGLNTLQLLRFRARARYFLKRRDALMPLDYGSRAALAIGADASISLPAFYRLNTILWSCGHFERQFTPMPPAGVMPESFSGAPAIITMRPQIASSII